MRINTYATHVPILAWAVANTTGPIIELGAGAYSTPLIHTLAKSRQVFSFDTDERYIEDLKFLRSETHTIEHVDHPTTPLGAALPHFGLVFIDCAPAESRRPCMDQLRERSDIVIVHDTDKASYYNLDEGMAKFSYSVTCKWFEKWTTVLSMHRPLADLERLVGTP